MPPPLTTKVQGSDVQLAEVHGQPTAMTFMPRNFAELDAFAERMAASRFVPTHMRGKPADCFAVALQALRWQMDPFSVAQQTYFTREGAPPAYMSQLINAVVHARAPLEGRLKITWAGDWKGKDWTSHTRTCTVSGKLRGDDDIKARTVHANTITVRNSPLWMSDPDQQLAYVATRAWARLFVSDVLMGIYSPDDEEMRAPHARDVTPPEERPQPTSRLDALEGIIDAEERPTLAEMTEVREQMQQLGAQVPGSPALHEATDQVIEITPHDPETGEVTEPDIFPPHEPPQPSAEEVETATTWANDTIRKIDTVVEADFLDHWLTRNKDKLARIRAVNPDAAMAVVEAADARKKRIEQELFKGELE